MQACKMGANSIRGEGTRQSGRGSGARGEDDAPLRPFSARVDQSRLCRGDLRHQGARVAFPARGDRPNGPQGLVGRSLDISFAFAGERGHISRRGRRLPSHRRVHEVFTGDRGSAVTAMAEAFAVFVTTRSDLAGLISAGGSGATALATPAMQRLPVGVPKVMVSTVASGDVRAYVEPRRHLHDLFGDRRLRPQSHFDESPDQCGACACRHDRPRARRRRDVQARHRLDHVRRHHGLRGAGRRAARSKTITDCLGYSMQTGTGGQAMEKLVASHLLAGVIDVTTTEIVPTISWAES